MTDIDIDTLDEAELLALNERIVERIHLLHRQKTDQALQQIKIGSAVAPPETAATTRTRRSTERDFDISADFHRQIVSIRPRSICKAPKINQSGNRSNGSVSQLIKQNISQKDENITLVVILVLYETHVIY